MKVNGLYVSEWDDGIEIQSEAVIDLETKEYIISVLNAYAGAFIIVSHESGFLDRLNLTNRYFIQNGTLKQKFR